jgi:hypothetical protein
MIFHINPILFFSYSFFLLQAHLDNMAHPGPLAKWHRLANPAILAQQGQWDLRECLAKWDN